MSSVYVAPSALGPHVGMGLYAARSFKKGERVTEYAGELLNQEQYQKRYGDKLGKYVLELRPGEYIDARDESHSGVGRFVNDCRRSDRERAACKGNNVHARTRGKKAFLYATRNIKPGDEIFWGYGRVYWKDRK
jgi:uncharacterized protein